MTNNTTWRQSILNELGFWNELERDVSMRSAASRQRNKITIADEETSVAN